MRFAYLQLCFSRFASLHCALVDLRTRESFWAANDQKVHSTLRLMRGISLKLVGIDGKLAEVHNYSRVEMMDLSSLEFWDKFCGTSFMMPSLHGLLRTDHIQTCSKCIMIFSSISYFLCHIVCLSYILSFVSFFPILNWQRHFLCIIRSPSLFSPAATLGHSLLGIVVPCRNLEDASHVDEMVIPQQLQPRVPHRHRSSCITLSHLHSSMNNIHTPVCRYKWSG